MLFKPKDVVSGDFYRFDHIKTNDQTGLKGFLVGVCTGHGAPGATLAILCSTLLKQSLSEENINSAGDSLEFVTKNLSSLFLNTDDENSIYDGMDAGFGVVNSKTKKLYYAGAFRDCHIVRSGEIITIKGDRQHVGFSDSFLPFTTHEFQLKSGDNIYITSDGYIDQFGGSEHRKFMMKRYLETIVQASTLPLNERKNYFAEVLEEWQGDLEQIDDICVIGVEIN